MNCAKPYTELQQNTLPLGRLLLKISTARKLLIGLGSTPVSCWNHLFLVGQASGTVSRLWIILCSIRAIAPEKIMPKVY